MSIFNVLNTAIYSTLTAGTALTSLLASGTSVHYLHARDGEAMPYIVWDYAGGGPENITPSDLRNNMVSVRCYALQAATAGTIDAKVSALLHNQTLNVTGYTNFSTKRETEISAVEDTPDGGKVYMSGASYRVRLDS